MSAAADKFSRLAALKPARPAPQNPGPLRLPDETDPISLLLGGGIATNCFGEHLAIRNWFSTPEFFPPSAAALELLSRSRDKKIKRRPNDLLRDPEKWLFLDTETTGLAGGTGTYPLLIGIAWWDAGGLQVEQFFMRDFGEEHSLLHELAARLAEHLGEEDLTARESEVLRLIRDGYRNKQIAGVLAIAETTVNFHIKNLVDKLGANDRTHAVMIALRRGLLQM